METFDSSKNIWYYNFCPKLGKEEKKHLEKQLFKFKILSFLMLIFPILIILFWVWMFKHPVPEEGGGGYAIGMIASFILSFVPFGKIQDIYDSYWRIYNLFDQDTRFKHYYFLSKS